MNFTAFKALFTNEAAYIKIFLEVFLVSSLVFGKNHRRLEKLVTVALSSFYLFNIFLFAINMLKTKVIFLRIEIMMQIVATVTSFIIIWATRQYQSCVRNFISILDDLEQNDKYIIVSATLSFKKLMLISLITCILTLFSVAVIPLVAVLFVGLDFRPLYSTVFYYSCENLIPIFCVPSDTYYKYFFNNIFQWISMTPQILLGFSFVVFYFLCYMFWTRYSQQLFARIRFLPVAVKILTDQKQREMEQRAERANLFNRRIILASWNYEREYDAILYSEFIEAIKQYQSFLRSV